MKVARHLQTQDVYMGRFNYGDDIITALQAFSLENNIRAAWVNIIGAVSKATLSYYDQQEHKYFSKAFKGEYEIVSCSGNISLKDEKPMAHIHIVLSDTEYGAHAGHLIPGSSAIFAGEFVIFAFDKSNQAHPDLVRVLDEQTGLPLWQ